MKKNAKKRDPHRSIRYECENEAQLASTKIHDKHEMQLPASDSFGIKNNAREFSA